FRSLKLNTGSGECYVMSGMLINLIIQIISGAVAGNVAAGAAKNIDLGTLGNTIAGAVGGGVGGQLLGMLLPLLANSASTPDIGSIIGQVAVAAWRVPFSRRSSAPSRTGRRPDRLSITRQGTDACLAA